MTEGVFLGMVVVGNGSAMILVEAEGVVSILDAVRKGTDVKEEFVFVKVGFDGVDVVKEGDVFFMGDSGGVVIVIEEVNIGIFLAEVGVTGIDFDNAVSFVKVTFGRGAIVE